MTQPTPHRRRPKRPWPHVIEKLSHNYVERHALECGFSQSRTTDYGIDLLITTFDEETAEVENGFLKLQVKSTRQISTKPKGREYWVDGRRAISVEVEPGHASYWIGERDPVFMVVFEYESRVCWWLHLQPYLRAHPNERLWIPATQQLDANSFRTLQKIKQSIYSHSPSPTPPGAP